MKHRGIVEWRTVAVAVVLRLWVGLAVGYGLLLLLGVDELTRNALLVTASAPTAVVVIVLATEFTPAPRCDRSRGRLDGAELADVDRASLRPHRLRTPPTP